MPESPRIDDLRRRVQKDPASIAFAQLAEECRRAEQYQEAIDTCRAGLALHPGYLSARVTLGRALIEIDRLDDAQTELELVLASAPENLAAIRGLAEIHHRRGSLAEALKQYRAALALAPNDPDLERTVTELSRTIEPKPAAPVIDGLSFEQMASELMKHSPPPVPPTAAAATTEQVPPPPLPQEPPTPVPASPVELSDAAAGPPADLGTPASEETQRPAPEIAVPAEERGSSGDEAGSFADAQLSVQDPQLRAEDAPCADTLPTEDAPRSVEDTTRAQALETIAALDQWLVAIDVARAQRRS